MPSIIAPTQPMDPESQSASMTLNPISLAFVNQCAKLERTFLEQYARDSLKQMRFALVLGILLYAMFGVLDYIIAPELTRRLWLVRYAVVCPSLLIVIGLSFTPRFGKIMQLCLFLLILIGGGGIVYMTLVGTPTINMTYYSGLMLVLMIGYTFVRARFLWASIGGCTVTVAYLIGTIVSDNLPYNMVVNNNFFCMSANFMGMLASYGLEFYARRDYYMSHLLALEHLRAEAANQQLEQTVQKRTAMLAAANEDLRQEIEAHQQLDREKKQLEDQLRQAQKMEAIGTLAGGIAHDFNNILAAIMGHTELALMQLDERTAAEKYLSEVLNASDRAKELVSQILSFSRRGDQELKPLQMSTIVKEAMRLIRSTLPTTIRIDTEIEEKNGIVVGNSTQIHQVMMNLCANAAHSMVESGGTLTIGLKAMEIPADGTGPGTQGIKLPGPGQFIHLVVADTGHGIPEHLLNRIFDPYFTTKEKDVGTGLGLAVVQGIVQNHGGTIEVASTPDRGTTFHIFLPRIQSQIKSDIKSLQVIPEGNEKILFVDDDAALAELGGKLLTFLGYRVVTESDPHRALKRFLDRPDSFDMVITDLIMPGLTGRELAMEILGRRPQIPILACTGFSERLDGRNMVEAGIKGILYKPITIYHLAQIVRRTLDGQTVETNERGIILT